jgi:predicted PurR-regulated permease PerM
MSSRNTITISTGSVIKLVMIPFLFFVLFMLRDLILIVLTAVVVASAVEPMAKWFIEYRFPRLLAVLLIYLALAATITLTFYSLFIPVLNETSSVLSTLSQYISTESVQSISKSETIQQNAVIEQLSNSFSLKEIAQEVNVFISNVSGGIFNTINVVFGGLLSFILIIVLSFYLAVQENGIPTFLSTISPIHYRNYIISLWRRAEKKIGLWMQGQVVLVVLVGILVYLGLTLLGIEHALLLAILAGMFEIIPIFGPILSAIPAIIIAFSSGDISLALLVTGLYIIIQQFENQLIVPLVIKKVVGVPSIVVILALIAGGKLAGFLGILLSVPLAAVAMEFFTDLQKGDAFEKK